MTCIATTLREINIITQIVQRPDGMHIYCLGGGLFIWKNKILRSDGRLFLEKEKNIVTLYMKQKF